jgi:hypothetical protein
MQAENYGDGPGLTGNHPGEPKSGMTAEFKLSSGGFLDADIIRISNNFAGY